MIANGDVIHQLNNTATFYSVFPEPGELIPPGKENPGSLALIPDLSTR